MSSGARPVLMLLPGLMCDAGVWRDQVAALGSDHDIRIPDFFGLDSMEAMARACLALAEGPFAVAGHSMGGRVAMHLAAMAPERVARVALIDTGAHPVEPGEAQKRQVLLDIGDAQGMAGVVRAWLPPMVAPSRLSDMALMESLTALILRASVPVLKGHTRALLGRADGFSQLETLRCPTAFIVGRQDAFSPPRQHQEMQAHVPGATLTVIEDCGHMAIAERPEAINAALKAWLAL